MVLTHNGKELMNAFQKFSPFKANGKLIARNKRKTILGANTDFPVELYTRGFIKAAAEGKQSPIIVQLSMNCCKKSGEGSIVKGAVLNQLLVEHYVEAFGAKKVFVSMDHFQPPKFRKMKTKSKSSSVQEAIEFLESKAVFGKEFPQALSFGKSLHAYALSQKVKEFKESFIETVKSIQPAIAMIDAAGLPFALNLALARELTQKVREFDKKVLIEAEFASCSEKGGKMNKAEIEQYAEKVIEFIKFTTGNMVSYGIGMKHGARFFGGETFKPDTKKLEFVQRALFKEFKKVVPFAQHGGTGSKTIPVGLSSKINVATYFKAVAMQSLEKHAKKNRKAILAGDKNACGTKPYFNASDAVAQATIKKLKQCHSFETASSA